MNALAIALILLSVPGLIFQLGEGSVSRVMRRPNRDVFSAISSLLFVSVLLVVGSFFLTNWFFDQAAQALFDVYIKPLLAAFPTNAPTSPADPVAANNRLITDLLKLGEALIATSFLGGVVWQKARTWCPLLFAGRMSALEAMKCGIREPVIHASVVSRTSIDKVVLVYKGMLNRIQLDPEGKIEYLTLSSPEKSVLAADGDNIPVAKSPFLAINASKESPRPTPPLPHAQKDSREPLLLIESDDIANVFLNPVQSARRGDPLDFLAYLFAFPFRILGRGIRWAFSSKAVI